MLFFEQAKDDTQVRELFNNLNKNPHKAFKKHFLKSIHLEIGFSSVSTESLLLQESALKLGLANNFGLKICKRLNRANVALTNLSDKEMKITNHSTTLGLIFSTENQKRELQVLSDRIVYSDHEYTGFTDLKTSLRGQLSFLFKTLNIPEDVNKIGFRKINSVRVDEATSYEDATAIFNPALFAVTNTGFFSPDALNSIESNLALEKDKKKFILRTNISKASEAASYICNLDFDLIDQNINKLDYVFDTVLPEINQLHCDLFIWAVTNDLIKVMEV
ncbi:MAG: TIGR04255 family protein [Bdellovibrio sp.]|nr:TIGR04255 family protein [Bdellovibrio sp.]